jgi:adenylyltransferase/sulfurtransferase
VVGAVPGVIGLLAALEALKIIVDGKAEILSGQLLLFDGLRARFKTVRLRQRQDSCILPCGKNPSLRDVQDLLQYDYEAFVNGEAQKPLVCEMKTLVQ